MKKVLPLISLLFLAAFVSKAQTIAFHENFELPSLADSVVAALNSGTGSSWGVCTTLHSQGLRSDSCQVKTGKKCWLTSIPFSTVGNSFVILNFSQICKCDFGDKAQILVSNDGGTNWTMLTSANYLGTGIFGSNGNSFSSNSYGTTWQPAAATAIPTNTWWKNESFDCSLLLANSPNCLIRFQLSDQGSAGAAGNWGWAIDNIYVTQSFSELNPPIITLVAPILTGTVYSLGPYPIRAVVTDASGIDTAYIKYTINNGPLLQVGMHHTVGDTMVGTIPAVSNTDTVCWYVWADDASPAHNFARNPVNTCNSFVALSGISFPYCDNFDVNTTNFSTTLSGSGSDWQVGTPSYNSTNSAHSPPNAWDVNLSTAYNNLANCTLLSPVFDFTSAVNARLSFWINYYSEASFDGVHMEYTTNGTTWQTLPAGPNATNWYNATINSSTYYSGPAWAGGPSGWQQCKYKLALLNNAGPYVRFRYLFTSDASVIYDGFSLDDFCITLPANQEAACTTILKPNTGCGLGNDTVRVRIANNGLQTINGGATNFVAHYRVKNNTTGIWGAVVNQNVPNTIAAGDSITFTFTQLANLTATVTNIPFTIKAWVDLPGDPNHVDDTTIKVITSNFVPPAPAVTNPSIAYGASTTLTATTGTGNTLKWFTAPCTGTGTTGATYTTPSLYALTVYYVNATNTNGCVSACRPDTVHVGAPPQFDGSATRWISPLSGIDLTSAEIVRIKLRNYGVQPISHFPVRYTKGTGTITDTCFTVIPPGDSITFTFAVPVNLSAYQSYAMKAWVDVPLDPSHFNDTIKKTVVNSQLVYCNSAAVYTNDDDIGNVTCSNINNGNPLPSLNNATSTNTYSNFTQTLPAMILSKGMTYTISVSQINSSGTYYTCYTKAFIDYNYNGTLDDAGETVLSAASPGVGNPFTGSFTVPTTAHTGYTRMRVTLQEGGTVTSVTPCDTYYYGETEDYLVMILPQIPHDAGVTAANVPLTYPTGFTQNPLVLTVKNFGTQALPNPTLTVSYKIDNGTVVTNPIPSTLAVGASTTIGMGTTGPLPVGTHYFKAWTNLAGDSNTFNDTLKITILGVAFDTIPYYNNFDGGTTQPFIPTGSGTTWIWGTPTGSNFPAPLPSPPKCWATNLNVAGGYTNGANCTLTTQYFNFTNAVNARLTFKYKYATEATLDGVTLMYSTNGGVNWSALGTVNSANAIPSNLWFNTATISGQAAPGWSGTGNTNWNQVTYKLNAFNGVPTLRFKFTFTSDGSVINNGFGIDDFKITIPYHKDAGVDTVKLPVGPLNAGIMFNPKLRLKNFGMDTLHSIPGFYQIDNQPPVGFTYTTVTGLLPDDTASYVVPTPFQVPVGSYCIKAWTNLPVDSDHNNDTAKSCLFGIPIFAVPFFDNFDTTHLLWYTSGTQWQHGVPTSPVINTAYSPPFCWKTLLASPYVRTGIIEYLYSPKFDFTISGYDSLKFYHYVHIFQNDGGKVEYLSNSGNWKTLGLMGDPNGLNWYNSGSNGFTGATGGVAGWHLSAYNIQAITDFAVPTQFRFAFSALYTNTNNFNGWAVDDFELTSPKIHQDAGVIAILSPTGTTTYGTNMQVTIRIKNFGIDTLTNIPVKFRINGITVGAGVWTPNAAYPLGLLPDSTDVFTFPVMNSPMNDYVLCSYTDVPTDTHYSNDTTCTNITVVPPMFDIGVTQIATPVAQTIHLLPVTVIAKIHNYGQNGVTAIPMTYTVGGNMIIVHDTMHLGTPLIHGQDTSFTFAQTYSYSFLGWYYLCVHVDYPNDGYRVNDTICRKIEEFYTGINEIDANGMALWQNNPNPADRTTEIIYHIPKPGEVDFEMVNYLGQKVYSTNERAGEGDHQIRLNTADMPAGVYYYYIRFDGKQLVRKMIIAH